MSRAAAVMVAFVMAFAGVVAAPGTAMAWEPGDPSFGVRIGEGETVPGAPTTVTVVRSLATAKVTWAAPASNGGSTITGYTATASPGGKTCMTAGALTCTISAMPDGVYKAAVTATNGVGTGPASEASALFRIDTTRPTATLTRPATPTKATTLSYTVTFSESVFGLTAADFTRTGTATGCVVRAPTGIDTTRSVPVVACSAGTVILALKANSVNDGAGNTGPAAVVTAAKVTIDRTVPTVTAPSTKLRTGVAVTAIAIPVNIAWTGADNAGGSGIARYELAKSADGGATWATVSTTLTTSPYATVAAPSGTARYRVRAVDKAGNTGAWKTGPVLVPRLAQETGPGLAYTGTWTAVTSTSLSGGAAKTASAAGASATYTFTGRSVGLVLTKGPTMGTVNIYLDGSTTPVAVSMYAVGAAYQKVAWQKTWATTGTHKVKLVVKGTAGHPAVELDALAVLFTDTTAPTATVPSTKLLTGAAVVDIMLPVRVSWTGADNAGGSGIARYELAKSADGGATWATIRTDLTEPWANGSIPAAGGDVRFRVRAIDRAGYASAWTAAGPALTPVLVQTTGVVWKTSSWLIENSSNYSGGSTKFASAANAWAEYSFTGRSIALVMTQATTRGQVLIFVDGSTTPTVVDTRAATTRYRMQVWAKTWSASGSHSVKIVVVGTSGRPRVDLDAISVLK